MGASYCDVAPGHPEHGPYHDREYGFPVDSDAALFERLVLEINQAGLSWLTILRKREAFRRAFDDFDPESVAAYGARERRRLLSDRGIVRNRAKIDAVIANAKTIVAIRKTHRLLRRVARCAPPAFARAVAPAFSRDVPVHGRRDRPRVPRFDRISPGRSSADLPRLSSRARKAPAAKRPPAQTVYWK